MKTELRALLTTLGFEEMGTNHGRVVFQRRMRDMHGAVNIEIMPYAEVDEVVSAIHRAGAQDQAQQSSYWFSGLVNCITRGKGMPEAWVVQRGIGAMLDLKAAAELIAKTRGPVVSACLDDGGWLFFDLHGDPVEAPEGWPETIHPDWLRLLGIKIAA